MPVRKFETQEHFVPAVMDGRILDFPKLFQEDDQPVYQYNELTLELGDKHKPKRTDCYVNGVTYLGSKGRDGEDASGFIELVQIDTPHGKRQAAIQGWMFAHRTGLPLSDTSWFCQFDDVGEALDFWHWWKGSFRIDDVGEALNERGLDPNSYDIQHLGLLKPWFQQKPEDRVVLDKFASSGREIIDTDRLTSCSKLILGQVYKLPDEAARYRRPKQEEYWLETCLGAFTTSVSSGGWNSWTRETTGIFVQWASGRTNTYLLGESNLPEPVEAREFFPKAVMESVTA